VGVLPPEAKGVAEGVAPKLKLPEGLLAPKANPLEVPAPKVFPPHWFAVAVLDPKANPLEVLAPKVLPPEGFAVAVLDPKAAKGFAV